MFSLCFAHTHTHTGTHLCSAVLTRSPLHLCLVYWQRREGLGTPHSSFVIQNIFQMSPLDVLTGLGTQASSICRQLIFKPNAGVSSAYSSLGTSLLSLHKWLLSFRCQLPCYLWRKGLPNHLILSSHSIMKSQFSVSTNCPMLFDCIFVEHPALLEQKLYQKKGLVRQLLYPHLEECLETVDAQ